jgi:hypothetical protein
MSGIARSLSRTCSGVPQVVEPMANPSTIPRAGFVACLPLVFSRAISPLLGMVFRLGLSLR